MKPFRILIVDDDELFRGLLAQVFACDGIRIDEAGTAEAAATLFGEKGHDLVITDYTMPGSSGAELVRKIRGIDDRIPVIGMSALDCRMEFLRAGATHFLRKPFEIRMLERLIERAVRKGR